jgi:hypothetical protein
VPTTTEVIDPSSPDGWSRALYKRKVSRDWELKSSTTMLEHVADAEADVVEEVVVMNVELSDELELELELVVLELLDVVVEELDKLVVVEELVVVVLVEVLEVVVVVVLVDVLEVVVVGLVDVLEVVVVVLVDVLEVVVVGLVVVVLVDFVEVVEEVVFVVVDDPATLAQTNWTLLICHFAVLEKPYHSTVVMAFGLAPAHNDQGSVYVWDAPVTPVTV